MKRWIACILIAAAVLSLGGCTNPRPEINDPVNFYYRRAAVSYGSADSVIVPESREAEGLRDNLTALLNRYIMGPESPELVNAFPKNCRVLRVDVTEDMAQVYCNRMLGYLENMDLTVACACLAKTVMELTGSTTVRIEAYDATLGGAEFIIMGKDNLLFEDTGAQQGTTPEK